MAKDDWDWHVPNAPTRSLRGLLIMAAALIRRSATHPILGLLRADIRELRFQCHPCLVDVTKLSCRFWSDPTPFEEGLRATLAFYGTAQR